MILHVDYAMMMMMMVKMRMIEVNMMIMNMAMMVILMMMMMMMMIFTPSRVRKCVNGLSSKFLHIVPEPQMFKY